MNELVAGIRKQLGERFGGRRAILLGGPAAGASRRVEQLRSLGVDRCLVIATGTGTGALPAAADADVVVCDPPAMTHLVEEFRWEERLFADPPAEVRAAIEQFDPDATALVIATPFSAVRSCLGRSLYGARRPEWLALEDKTGVDAIFDDVGIARPPSAVVPANELALTDAAVALDQGAGTVWSGDARDGFNGGAVFVRWVRDDETRREATAFFGARCARVRIAPFVEGIPCSIHGIVTGDGVAVLRPVELVTLRAPRPPYLRYAGAATFFDPPEADRTKMRVAAGALGDWLATRVDFRGAFTLDGILARDGWLATECNPRFGAGLGHALTAVPDLPLDLVNHALVAGDLRDLGAVELEAALVPAADATRWGGTWISTATATTTPSETTRAPIAGDDHGFHATGDGETTDAYITFGPGGLGAFVRVEFCGPRTPTGPSIAPRAVAALAYADAAFGAGLGPLMPAVPVR